MSSMTLPPGFRFHPTDDELVGYYLKRKVDGLKIELEVIPVIELYKYDPWELPDKSFLPTRDMEWFFFCPRDRKYPNGSRTNRATSSGYWKATGKDRKIVSESSVFGLRKTLVFYRGRAPGGQRTNWIMHEYRLCEDLSQISLNFVGAYALCRIAKRTDNGLKIDHNGHSDAKRRIPSPMPYFNCEAHVGRESDGIDDSPSPVTSAVGTENGSALITSPEVGMRSQQQQIILDPENIGFWETHMVSDASKALSPNEEITVSLSGLIETANIVTMPSYPNFPEETIQLSGFYGNQSFPSFPSLDHCLGMYTSVEDNLVQNLEFQGPKYFNTSYTGNGTWNSLPYTSICRQESEEEALVRWLQDDNMVLT